MHILNTIEILHENPYTGDKITKACIMHMDPTVLAHAPDLTNSYANRENDSSISSNSNGDNINSKDGNENRTLPRLIAIKYLSDFRITRTQRYQEPDAAGVWDSDDYGEESEGSEDDGRDDSPGYDQSDHRIKQGQGRWRLVGETRQPPGVRFGVKARREIRALRAAQGHPNVIPFLGFTGPPAPNPFKQLLKKKQQDKQATQEQELYGGGLLLAATALASTTGPTSLARFQEESQPRNGHSDICNDSASNEGDVRGGSLLGSALLGGSLFHEMPQEQAPLSSAPMASSKEFFPPFRNSGFNSDYDSESSLSDDEREEDGQNTSGSSAIISEAATIQTWSRILSRQPRLGGILLPYVPLTLQDLIQVGWTKTRPLMAETCMRQILEGLIWIHDEARLMHRDISAGNILVTVVDGSEDGVDGERRGVIQCMISDFGCAAFIDHDESNQALEMSAKQSQEPEESSRGGLTFEVGTRAYRAPELLFSSGDYTSAVDIWSAGVLFAELFLGRTLFQAESDIGQVCAIVKVLGTPTDVNWPEYSMMPDYGKLVFQALETDPLSNILLSDHSSTEPNDAVAPPTTHISKVTFELIERMVAYSGSKRPSAKEALAFKDRYLERNRHWELLDPNQKTTTLNKQEQTLRQEFLKQCILYERVILKEKERLRRLQMEEEDEYDEYDEYGGEILFEGPSGQQFNYDGGDQVEGGEDDEAGYRSDDLSGVVDGCASEDAGCTGKLTPAIEIEGAYGYEEYEESGPGTMITTATTITGSPRAAKRHRMVNDDE
ncbi:hypothetical protein EDD11_006522 [Mortierella claussenii]|nr:hypothetical protein EDD11_006522 [Mortierella claussenii]